MTVNAVDYRLRPARMSDSELVCSWRNQERVRRVMFTDHVISSAEHERWFEQVMGSPQWDFRMLDYKGRPAGVVNLDHIDRENRRCSWGFYLGEEALPAGSGSAMLFLAADHAFNRLGIRKLCAEVLSFNEPGLRIHRRLGFEREGVLREHVYKEERLVDVIVLALFEDAWNESRDRVRNEIFDR